MIRILYSILFCAISFLLVSCAAPPYQVAANSIVDTKQQIHAANQISDSTPPPVVINHGYYVDTQPVSLAKTPAWMQQNISLQAQSIPMSVLVNRILRNANISVDYDNTVAAAQPITLNYSGTIQGALDRIAAKTNYNYQIQDQELLWSSFVSKTFDISFMPGTSNYLVGQTENQTNGGTSSGTSGTYSTSNSSNTSALNDNQYSNLQGQLSVWDDIRQTLNELKSKNGKVYVSQSTSTVTVYDHRENVQTMSNYINKLNQTLTQEVGIKVQVLEVDLKDEYNSGINWNLVATTLGTKFSLTAPLADATNIAALSTVRGANGSSGVSMFQIGEDSNNALIQALDQQGDVRIVTRPQVVTMNDQIASIRITQDTGYLESVQSTISQSFSSTSLTPGTVTEGLTLYILPRIEDDNVFMQITSTLSDLLRIDTVSSTGAVTNTNGNNSNNSSNNQSQANQIEVPTIAEKSFNQRSVVKSGSTLIIAGYKQLRNETSDSSLFGVQALGGKGATNQDVETLVLITPVILKTNE